MKDIPAGVLRTKYAGKKGTLEQVRGVYPTCASHSNTITERLSTPSIHLD